MASADGALSLETTGLASPDQAFSNALYVHPLDFAKIAEIAGADAERVKDVGVLCAVGEAVFFVRQSVSYKPGSIGAGMMQRVAGQLLQSKPTPVTPFFPPRGKFPIANVVAEVDLVSGAPPPGQVRCRVVTLRGTAAGSTDLRPPALASRASLSRSTRASSRSSSRRRTTSTCSRSGSSLPRTSRVRSSSR